MLNAHLWRGLLLLSVVLLCAAAFAWHDFAAPTNASGSPAPDAERDRLLGIGKELFVARCASCHNERGDKPLEHGPPLNQRKLTPEVIDKNVSGRFKSATPEQRRAVALYIESFLVK
jgi:mono/diheme cytochrome c family protein